MGLIYLATPHCVELWGNFIFFCFWIYIYIRKCNVKNRVRVALSAANPPHTQWTTSFLHMELQIEGSWLQLHLRMVFVFMEGHILWMLLLWLGIGLLHQLTKCVWSCMIHSMGFVLCVSRYRRKTMRLHLHAVFVEVILSLHLDRCVLLCRMLC